MNLFVLDTDILTLFQRNDATVMTRVSEHLADAIAISVVTVEEQLSGWYAQLRQAKAPEKLAWAYRRLAANVRFLARVRILDFEEAAIQRYLDSHLVLRADHLGVGFVAQASWATFFPAEV